MNLSKQAKAIASAVALALVQIQVYVGQGGTEALTKVSLGQWISVVLGVLAGYGVVYAIPNAPVPPPVVATDQVKVIVDSQMAELAAALNQQPVAGEHEAP